MGGVGFMDLLLRDQDVFSGKNDLEVLHTIKDFPVYMGVSDLQFSEDLFADMKWGISKSSGMLQLLELVPEEILYKNSHNGSIGNLWKEHHTKFAELIHESIGNYKRDILEIGGGNGILNAIYNERYNMDGQWVIVEPSSVKPVNGCTARYIRKIWGDGTSIDLKKERIECLVHSHVLEHLYDIENFMLQSGQLLENGKKMIFSIPNLKETLRRKYTNALNFEHTYFISEDYVEEILRRHSFKILEKQFFKEDHSIFYVTEKNLKVNDKSSIDFQCLYAENKQLFMNFIKSHQKLVSDFNQRMNGENFSHIYLFGAHIFSQYLICFGLDESKIQYVLDNDTMKQGKRLYGTQLIVKPPEILAEEKSPIVILRVANYAEEIKRDIICNINPNVIFWE